MKWYLAFWFISSYVSIGKVNANPTPPKFAEEFTLQYKIHNSQFGFTVIGK